MLSVEMIVSSFFKKGKDACWKLVEKYQKFEACFANLGMEPVLSEVVFAELEEYVATLYGEKAKSADEARWKIFKKKHQ